MAKEFCLGGTETEVDSAVLMEHKLNGNIQGHTKTMTLKMFRQLKDISVYGKHQLSPKFCFDWSGYN